MSLGLFGKLISKARHLVELLGAVQRPFSRVSENIFPNLRSALMEKEECLG